MMPLNDVVLLREDFDSQDTETSTTPSVSTDSPTDSNPQSGAPKLTVTHLIVLLLLSINLFFKMWISSKKTYNTCYVKCNKFSFLFRKYLVIYLWQFYGASIVITSRATLVHRNKAKLEKFKSQFAPQ